MPRKPAERAAPGRQISGGRDFPPRPGSSPYALVQERFPRGPLYPWRVLVACTLLNRTRGTVAIPIAAAILRRWPTPRALALARRRDLETAIRSCGLYRGRAARLKLLSAAWAAGIRNPEEIPGLGRYARDSFAVFVEGRLPPVADGWLRLYTSWVRRRRRLWTKASARYVRRKRGRAR